jgi:membrane-associated protease RseP (regulator of RpoE activity)
MNTVKSLFLLLVISCFGTITHAQDKAEVKKTKKAFMGVTLGISWGDGVEISEVSKNYGADKAGLQVGDIITAINGDKIGNKDEFTKILAKHTPGEQVEVAYVRANEKKLANVKLAESPYGISISGNDWNWNWDGNMDDLKVKLKKKSKAFLGIYPQTDWDERAIRIDGFSDNSAAREAGLKKNDFILKIAEDETNTEDELRYALGKHKPGDEVEVTYKRNGKTDRLKVKLGEEKVVDWDNFNISLSDDDEDDNPSQEKKPSRTWSSYTFADGTEVSINDFSINPSQINDNAEVSFESKLAKPFSVVIYNAEGKEVNRKEQASLEGKFLHNFDTKNLPRGEYFIKIWMDGKEVFSQKMKK